MIGPRSIFYFLRTHEEVYNAKTIEQLLRKLVVQGYLLTIHREYAEISKIRWGILHDYVVPPPDWTDLAPERTFVPGISRQLRQEITHFCEEQPENISFAAYATARSGIGKGFEFDVHLSSRSNLTVIVLTFSDFHFTHLKGGNLLYEQWLEGIVRMIYKIWHPIYAYEFDHRNGIFNPTEPDEVYALKVTRLYETNLFGPELVRKFGRHRLETAPAQKVIPLDDGGMMIIPGTSFDPTSLQDSWIKVARHLGLAIPEDYPHYAEVI
jgi:hypothetical protein